MQIGAESAIKGNENKRCVLMHLCDVWGLRRDRLNLRTEKNSFEGRENASRHPNPTTHVFMMMTRTAPLSVGYA